MATTNSEATMRELQREIAAAAKGSGAHGVPAAVRLQAVAIARARRAAGITARRTAAILGVHETTLSRWSREVDETQLRTEEAGRGEAFRAVRIAPTAQVMVNAVTRSGIRVAHAPSGLVIEGLDVEALAALLRSLS